MSNTWFQFKEFRIAQDRCAMKVTTDACIQGAWTPLTTGTRRVLDIGAGTGLLSLMLAQRDAAITIDAVEYDADAAAQAKENVAASLWHDRISVLHGDVRDHYSTQQYDLIICNPPFFNNSLLSGRHSKDLARHTISLSTAELLKAITANLAPAGQLSILLPYAEYQQWLPAANANGLHEQQCLHIKHTTDAPVKRVVSILSRQPTSLQQQTLVIKDAQGYTDNFRELLSPFYLDL